MLCVRNIVQKRWYKDPVVADGAHPLPLGKSDRSMAATVSFLTKDMNEAGLVGIRGLSSAGFRLYDGTFLYGPIAVFPKTVLSWRVVSPENITPESLELFFMLQPKIDILVVGVGDRSDLDAVRNRIAPVVKEHKIGLEIMPTEDAIPTFNFLNNEMRYVAAALYPPRNLVVTDDEYAQALLHMRDYFEMDEHPLLQGVVTNWANPTESLVERIWGKPNPELVATINQIGDEAIQRKAERIRARHEPREPEELESTQQDLRKLKDKNNDEKKTLKDKDGGEKKLTD
ncbi:hypothetical protein FO519_004794 [Halicephalobus sp. NKZ332]|nr:hypothetical protein FO519_004794 [Halicephalobus sp. NKZ332]